MRYLTEIEKKVFDKYPVTDKEKNCRVEKNKRDWLREQYKKELTLNDEQKTISKQEYDHQPEV
jgi:hypothetical protein